MGGLHSRLWSIDDRNLVAQFRRTREEGFREFRERSEPSPLTRIRYSLILELNFQDLRNALQEEIYTATDVLKAYVWRAMKIQKEINCITEVIREAFIRAEELDEKYYQKNETKPPLYGMPFSVKSNFNVEGYAVTVGLVKHLKERKTSTCPFVQYLSDLGAIPFCLTNVPQGLLSYVTTNPIYGVTKNPWDLDRTPGGSSGGEAALLAAGGAAFGVGSDLAGSLRIPAAFCGLVTLKPTQDRLVTTGTHGGLPGRGRLGLSFGFYTRTVDDQYFLLNLIIGSPEYRKLCPMSSPATLQDFSQERRRKLRFGYFVDDGFQPVVPSNRRAVNEVVEKLRANGYECEPFHLDSLKMRVMEKRFLPFLPKKEKFYGVTEFADMMFRNVMPDNGTYMANDIYNGEPSAKYMCIFIWMIWLKQTLLAGPAIGCLSPLIRWSSRTASVLAESRNWTLAGMRRNQERTDMFKEVWLKSWKDMHIDALICPSFITPAQEFDYPQWLSTGTFSTGIFNMLDVPAGVVPVGHVNEDDIRNLRDPSIFPDRGDSVLKGQRETCLGTEGLPLAVQIVTLPNEEEVCLQAMRMVESLTRSDVKKLEWATAEDPPAGTVETGKQKSLRLFDRPPLYRAH